MKLKLSVTFVCLVSMQFGQCSGNNKNGFYLSTELAFYYDVLTQSKRLICMDNTHNSTDYKLTNFIGQLICDNIYTKSKFTGNITEVPCTRNAVRISCNSVVPSDDTCKMIPLPTSTCCYSGLDVQCDVQKTKRGLGTRNTAFIVIACLVFCGCSCGMVCKCVGSCVRERDFADEEQGERRSCEAGITSTHPGQPTTSGTTRVESNIPLMREVGDFELVSPIVKKYSSRSSESNRQDMLFSENFIDASGQQGAIADSEAPPSYDAVPPRDVPSSLPPPPSYHEAVATTDTSCDVI